MINASITQQMFENNKNYKKYREIRLTWKICNDVELMIYPPMILQGYN